MTTRRATDRVRRVGVSLVLGAWLMVAFAIAPTPAHAAAYIVNNTGDGATGSGTSGTLRYVIAQANANPGSTITFAPATNGTTITVGSEIDITANVTITGNGAPNTQITYIPTVAAPFTVMGSATLDLRSVGINSASIGVYSQSSGAVSVRDTVFTGNFGISTQNSGTLSVDRTLFSGLTSGGVTVTATATITNSSFSGDGIGVNALTAAPGVIAGSTFSGNSVAISNPFGFVTLTNSIVAGSTNSNCSGTITDGGHNFAYGVGVPDTTCPAGFTRTQDPRIGSLGIYGAPNGVQSLALLPGSPAIDAGSCNYTDALGTARVLATDARGVARPQGTACDSGGFEARGFTLTALTGNGQSATVTTTFAAPLTAALGDPDMVPVTGSTVTFTLSPGSSGAPGAGFVAPGGTGCTIGADALSAVCPVNMSGVATAPTLKAGIAPGNFAVVASAAGVSGVLAYILTNTTGAGFTTPQPPRHTNGAPPAMGTAAPQPMPPHAAATGTPASTPVPQPGRR